MPSSNSDDWRVIEGIVGSLDPDGTPHFAAMGPRVPTAPCEEWSILWLAPFADSQTLANLTSHPKGTFHVLDDALLIAEIVTGTADSNARGCLWEGEYPRLAESVWWCAFDVVDRVASSPRVQLECEIVNRSGGRTWCGWNRAQHAVLELAILFTRAHLLPKNEIRSQIDFVRPWVEKTGGPRERQAWSLLEAKLAEEMAS